MKHSTRLLTLLTLMIASLFLIGTAYAGSGQGEKGFVDLNGDGINDNMRDDDADGIPNCLDADYVMSLDGNNNQNANQKQIKEQYEKQIKNQYQYKKQIKTQSGDLSTDGAAPLSKEQVVNQNSNQNTNQYEKQIKNTNQYEKQIKEQSQVKNQSSDLSTDGVVELSKELVSNQNNNQNTNQYEKQIKNTNQYEKQIKEQSQVKNQSSDLSTDGTVELSKDQVVVQTKEQFKDQIAEHSKEQVQDQARLLLCWRTHTMSKELFQNQYGELGDGSGGGQIIENATRGSDNAGHKGGK